MGNKKASEMHQLALKTLPETKTTVNLVEASETVLHLLLQVKLDEQITNVDQLHQEFVAKVKNIFVQLHSSGVSEKVIVLVGCFLCASIDEIVMRKSGRISQYWMQNTLSRIFYQETHMGEYLYEVVKKLIKSPEGNQRLIELVYLLVSIGYQGKLHSDPEKHGATREKLFNCLQNQSSSKFNDLYYVVQKNKPIKKPRNLLLKFTLIAAMVILGATLILNLSAYIQIKPTLIQLQKKVDWSNKQKGSDI
jgi:type IV/VI secretion system ImpK/VasF family protein